MMKTDELVRLLAQGPIAVAPHAVARRHLLALAGGGAVAGLMMLLTIGLNPALGAATRLPGFWLKLAFAAVLCAVACLATSRLARPGAPLRRLPAWIAAPLVAMWLLAGGVWLQAAGAEREALLFGTTWSVCPVWIAVLSVPLFAALTWAMRGLAPTRLRAAGAATGLLAGASAALLYGLHCPEMAPPFVAVWYVAGIALPTALGAALGPRLLRW